MGSLLVALSPILHLDAALADSLDAAAPPLEEVVLPAIVETCATTGEPFVLVLDDLHLRFARPSPSRTPVTGRGQSACSCTPPTRQPA